MVFPLAPKLQLVLDVKRGKLDIESKTGGELMTAITFDTHKFVRTLKDAGVPESQAEAFSEAIKEAQGEADLATKRDIDDLRRDIDVLHSDMDARFIQTEQRLVIKLGGLMVLSIGVVAALVKLLPAYVARIRRKRHLALRLGGLIPADEVNQRAIHLSIKISSPAGLRKGPRCTPTLNMTAVNTCSNPK